MPPKPKKVKQTFNALGVTGGAPKFKPHARSARKPTSWERKALKEAAAANGGIDSPASDRVKPREIVKKQQRGKNEVKQQQRPVEPSRSSSSSSSSSSDGSSSSDESSSSDGDKDTRGKQKGSSSSASSKTKKTKKEKVVSITFEHFPVEERDFHGISGLLTNFVGGFEYHAGDLADICISVGDTIGSVQKVDEGSDPLGILSCVNMQIHSNRPSIQTISSMLLQRCPKEMKSQIKQLLSDSSTALVVSSRILNVPDALALPLWKGLLDEITAARKSGKAGYQLNTLLLLCPVVACEDGSPFYMRGEEESVLQQVLDGVGDAAIPGFAV